MYFADFISGSRNFKKHLTSGVLILIHSVHLSCGVCRFCARVHLKTLCSLLRPSHETEFFFPPRVQLKLQFDTNI